VGKLYGGDTIRAGAFLRGWESRDESPSQKRRPSIVCSSKTPEKKGEAGSELNSLWLDKENGQGKSLTFVWTTKRQTIHQDWEKGA